MVSLVSGGLDSTSYAALWKHRGYDVYPVIFDYGQKGRREVEVAKRLSMIIGFEEPLVLNVSSLKSVWLKTQLLDELVKVEENYSPTVVVPIRNVVFITIACAYALSIGADIVAYGAHLNDIATRADTGEPLYPDCHPNVALALEEIIRIAHFPVGAKKLEVWSPAREGFTKTQVLKKGYELLGDLIYETWSCYLSDSIHCGTCESCINRHKAFIEAMVPDKTRYKEHSKIHEKCFSGDCGVNP
ncbi:MAG: 7-cyano-7-deazaguanine synthase [Candidatus Nezhaarchaeales archaeon]